MSENKPHQLDPNDPIMFYPLVTCDHCGKPNAARDMVSSFIPTSDGRRHHCCGKCFLKNGGQFENIAIKARA